MFQAGQAASARSRAHSKYIATSVSPPTLQPGDIVVDFGAGVTVPQPGYGVTSQVLTKSGEESVGAQTSATGVVTLFSVGDEMAASTLSVMPFAGLDPCTDSAYNLTPPGVFWNSTYNWYLVTGSVPAYLNLSSTIDALRNATQHLTNIDSGSCNLTDHVSATAAYQGSSSQSVNINSNGTCHYT